MKQELFDQFGKRLGFIEQFGNYTQIYDSMGRLRGKYDPISNQVYDNMGRLVGKGKELLGMLLR